MYTSALVSSEPEILYACSADRKVCQLEDDETGTRITASFDTDTVLTQLCLPPGDLLTAVPLSERHLQGRSCAYATQDDPSQVACVPSVSKCEATCLYPRSERHSDSLLSCHMRAGCLNISECSQSAAVWPEHSPGDGVKCFCDTRSSEQGRFIRQYD